jgi:hypothetical protein
MDAGESRGWKMSKLNQPTNLRTEDYPDQAAWISRLFAVINPFIRSVQTVFDSNIDFSTNIRSVTKDYDQTSFIFPIVFQWPYTEVKPVSLQVLAATNTTAPTCLIPAWSYDSSKSELSVNYLNEISSAGVVSALTQGVRYKFSIRVTV